MPLAGQIAQFDQRHGVILAQWAGLLLHHGQRRLAQLLRFGELAELLVADRGFVQNFVILLRRGRPEDDIHGRRRVLFRLRLRPHRRQGRHDGDCHYDRRHSRRAPLLPARRVPVQNRQQPAFQLRAACHRHTGRRARRPRLHGPRDL